MAEQIIRWDEMPPGAVGDLHGHDRCGRHRSCRGPDPGARLLALREEWSYGTMDGPDHTHWAWIRDVATDAEDNIYAVDGLLVRVLSPTGEFLAETFRIGEGPMEMRSPAGIEWIDGRLNLRDGWRR